MNQGREVRIAGHIQHMSYSGWQDKRTRDNESHPEKSAGTDCGDHECLLNLMPKALELCSACDEESLIF